MVGDVVWFMPRILAGPMAPRLRPQQRCIRSCIDCAARRSVPLSESLGAGTKMTVGNLRCFLTSTN